MAKIIEIQENGESKFVKTHIQAVTGAYEVGDIHISIKSDNPSERFGGTWERFGKGQMLLGVDENDSDFNDSSKTGGEKAHILDIGPDKNANEVGFTTPAREGVTGYGLTQVGTFSNRAAVVIDSNTSFKPKAHNNMPPYITVYMWVKTE